MGLAVPRDDVLQQQQCPWFLASGRLACWHLPLVYAFVVDDFVSLRK